MTTAGLAQVARVGQGLAVGDLVTLFRLDLTPIGQPMILSFTSSNFDGNSVHFGGTEYFCVAVKAEGFEYTGQGPFPRPLMTISNVKHFLSGVMYELNDLVGAKLFRIRTYRQFLDGQSDADPEAYYPPDIYTIEQKTKHTRAEIEFQLSAAVDQQGVTLPRRKIFRDTCTHSYRMFQPGVGFVYTGVTCPYVSLVYFDEDGDSTGDASKDQCGFRLSDCKKRFPNQALPTRAFPGVNRYTLQ